MKISVPVILSVDVLVIGGTVRAIRTALALRAQGRSVFIATPYPYFGEDLSATLDLFSPKSDDFIALFDSPAYHTPAQIKARLDKLCIEADIDFLFQLRPVRPAYDRKGNVRGALFACRSGFVAVGAKVVIDATERATFARMAGVPTKPFKPGKHTMRTFVIGGVNEDNPDIKFRKLDKQIVKQDPWGKATDLMVRPVKRHDVYEVWYDGRPCPSDDFRQTWTSAVQFRKALWSGKTLEIAERVICDYGDGVEEKYEPDAKLPVFIAERADANAVENFIKAAKGGTGVACVSFREKAIAKRKYDVVRADHAEFHRFKDKPQIEFDLNSIPEIGETDVFVVGGGTGGAPAAIGAARELYGQGSSLVRTKVICAENLNMLGGVMLVGRIGRYWYGNRVGFTREVDEGHRDMAPNPQFDISDGQMNVLWKHEWFMERGLEKGVCWMFDTMCAGAAVVNVKTADVDVCRTTPYGGRPRLPNEPADQEVCRTAAGVVVVNEEGVGVIRAKFVIDATGNSDFAAAAGAETACDLRKEPAVQGAGLSPTEPGANYLNTDYTFTIDSDVVDTSRAFVMAHAKFAQKWFDVASIVNSRERRRIVGDVTLQPYDFYANRTWADTINRAMSNFDTHGFTIHPMFMVKPAAEHSARYADVPLRALLPKGWDGMAVTGLGVSAHRDCMPLIRMQPDVQNQGYAMGRAAAICVERGLRIRDIDVRELQGKLVAEGILGEKVLRDKDVPCEFVEGDEYHDISRAFMEAGTTGLPACRTYGHGSSRVRGSRAVPASSSDTAGAVSVPGAVSVHVSDAMTLAFLGDASGRDVLERFIESEWDKGWNYYGMGQFGAAMSPQDVAIVALSRTGFSQRGKNLLMKKLAKLTAESEFSHIRAVALAFIAHPSKTAAADFNWILSEPGMTGYAVSNYRDAVASNRPAHNDNSFRNSQLKEIYLAKALRACDPESELAGRILAAYRNGMQGLYVEFAG